MRSLLMSGMSIVVTILAIMMSMDCSFGGIMLQTAVLLVMSLSIRVLSVLSKMLV